MEVDERLTTLDEPQFTIRNLTLLLVEGTIVPNAWNIRESLNASLLQKYEVGLDHFLKYFAMVTDSAAVMARVANASVSHELHSPDERWMGCYSHFLNNVMKQVL